MAMGAEPLVVRTPALAIACEAHGDARGVPVVLLHGFPDDVRAYDGVVPPLVAAGHRVIVPYLRGYGPTRFLDPSAPRMAQQAAIGQDLLDLMTALDLGPAVLAGYDWGGRAACIASLLAPEKRWGFLHSCAAIEKSYTDACAAAKDPCLESGCSCEGEVCLQPLLRANTAYQSQCGAEWAKLFADRGNRDASWPVTLASCSPA